MSEISFKPLTPQQIEVRPTNTKNKGRASLLLYIDSRAAAEILDDTFGAFNWQIEYKPINDKIYGRLSILNTITNQWVAKEDTGSESNIEADKGQASDILKRCLARWGCNFLYSAPEITINCPDKYYYNDKLSMSFKVSEIEYIDKKISQLTIVDKFNNIVFNWNKDGENTTTSIKKTDTPTEEKNDKPVSKKDTLILFCKENKTEENKDSITAFYKFYLNKIDNWTGTFDVKKLYTLWEEKRNSKNLVQ